MAEFVEVMKQRIRMCNAHHACDGCPLIDTVNGGFTCTETLRGDPAKYESIVMRWGEEHPEPQYPTWEQWQMKMFPDYDNIDGVLLPCSFASKSKLGCKREAKCTGCRMQRIPADIAEKLGIKPGEEWE